MNQVFPYANVVAGVLVLIVGFVFHWIGQLISILNWDLATRIGLQEAGFETELVTDQKHWFFVRARAVTR